MGTLFPWRHCFHGDIVKIVVGWNARRDSNSILKQIDKVSQTAATGIQASQIYPDTEIHSSRHLALVRGTNHLF